MNFHAIAFEIVLWLTESPADDDNFVTGARQCVRHFKSVSPDSAPARFFGILLTYKTNAESFSRSFSSCGETRCELSSKNA